MIDGFYSVVFQTPRGMGGGVIVLDKGTVRGGDSGLYYTGSYKAEGSKLTAQLITDAHIRIAGVQSVFGIDKARLQVSGTQVGDTITGKAVSPDAPGVTMTFTMRKLPG